MNDVTVKKYSPKVELTITNGDMRTNYGTYKLIGSDGTTVLATGTQTDATVATTILLTEASAIWTTAASAGKFNADTYTVAFEPSSTNYTTTTTIKSAATDLATTAITYDQKATSLCTSAAAGTPAAATAGFHLMHPHLCGPSPFIGWHRPCLMSRGKRCPLRGPLDIRQRRCRKAHKKQRAKRRGGDA